MRRQLLVNVPVNEIAVCQEEIGIHPNPKGGALWMRRGHQATTVTPGTNEKRSLTGVLNWRTGVLLVTESLHKKGRSAALLIRHLKAGPLGNHTTRAWHGWTWLGADGFLGP